MATFTLARPSRGSNAMPAKVATSPKTTGNCRTTRALFSARMIPSIQPQQRVVAAGRGPKLQELQVRGSLGKRDQRHLAGRAAQVSFPRACRTFSGVLAGRDGAGRKLRWP